MPNKSGLLQLYSWAPDASTCVTPPSSTPARLTVTGDQRENVTRRERFTCVSSPSMISITKKHTAQSWGSGIMATAWGNAMNAKPGPSGETAAVTGGLVPTAHTARMCFNRPLCQQTAQGDCQEMIWRVKEVTLACQSFSWLAWRKAVQSLPTKGKFPRWLLMHTWFNHHVDRDSLAVRHEAQNWEDHEAGNKAGAAVEGT